MITVPDNSPIVISAAAGFRARYHDVLTRKVDSQGCISLLRLYSGFPLKVCQCLPHLKNAYDQIIHTPYGAALHLYANTGRDHSGNGSPDWALLPSPLETL